MGLNNLRLFKNVKITPDYSVVHDMTPETWRQFLTGELWETVPDWNTDSPEQIYSGNVNYYRLPETIRIEGNFDELRQATYGFLHDIKSIRTPSFGTVFFFVEDVRLLKQGSRFDQHQEGTEEQPVVYVDAVDVCELDIKIDVWSSYGGAFQLYDSYVERRHMDRWKNTGTEQDPVWEPIYYPNAAQGVEGAYRLETKEDAYKNTVATFQWDPLAEGAEEATASLYFVQISVLKDNGQCNIYGIPVGIVKSRSYWWHVNIDENPSGNGYYFYNLMDILNGTFLSDIGITADFVQSIVIYPMMSNLLDSVTFDGSALPPKMTINLQPQSYMTSSFITGKTKIFYRLNDTGSQLRASHKSQSKTVTVVGPDHAAVGQEDYDDEAEPMMYFMPARQRKVVTSLGGEVFTIPDVAALKDIVSMLSLSELSSGNIFVYFGDDIVEANALGACGVIDCATLPIYNSAWKSYEAISKVSDTIMFNAKQMQTVGSGATSTALGGIGGFVQGGPAGAIAGVISGVVGTGLSYYGNEEELRAKQMQIKNSPCNVKSPGSGVTAAVEALVTLEYVTLKMDDVSMEKLRFMYYWYGYHVNRVFKGDIDLHTRTRFDFIKTSGARVKGDLTAGAAREIGSIFDRGVTIYHGPEGYALIGSGDMVANDEV